MRWNSRDVRFGGVGGGIALDGMSGGGTRVSGARGLVVGGALCGRGRAWGAGWASKAAREQNKASAMKLRQIISNQQPSKQQTHSDKD